MSKFNRKISETLKKSTATLFAVAFLTFLPFLLFAQTGPPPCDPSGTEGDPYTDTCPLDSWVWVLVILAIVAVTYQTFRKRKAINS
jgi:hypothetical protein